MTKLIKLFLVNTGLVRRILKMIFLFAVTCHHKIEEIVTMIRDYFRFIYSDEDVQIFLPPPMVSQTCARKLKDYIIRSKLYPLEINLGCRGCGNSRCQVCKTSMATDTFDSVSISNCMVSSVFNDKFDE